jgi:hypothetical protein
MNSRTALWSVALVGLLSVSAAACSNTGTTRVSMGSMCQKSGGTYSGGTCLPPSNPQTAAQLCAAHGGQYMAGGDYCEVDNGLLWKPLP